MFARVAKWEGAEADALRQSADDMNARAGDGPPPGVPAKGFMMLVDPDSGRSLAIALFDSEEDMKAGDAVLNDMSPSTSGTGSRSSVELYEVAVDVRV
jgi:hypothetical protein